jgi:hypothetical protein
MYTMNVVFGVDEWNTTHHHMGISLAQGDSEVANFRTHALQRSA